MHEAWFNISMMWIRNSQSEIRYSLCEFHWDGAKFAIRFANYHSEFAFPLNSLICYANGANQQSEFSELANFQWFALNSHSEIRSSEFGRNSEFAFALKSHSGIRSGEFERNSEFAFALNPHSEIRSSEMERHSWFANSLFALQGRERIANSH